MTAPVAPAPPNWQQELRALLTKSGADAATVERLLSTAVDEASIVATRELLMTTASGVALLVATLQRIAAALEQGVEVDVRSH